MIFLVALLLCVWFWRRSMQDASWWMVATYVGVGLLIWTDYSVSATMTDAFPQIVRDFLILGMVGLVQSLAVHKRMPIWLAIVLTLGIFFAAHLLEEYVATETVTVTESPATEEIPQLSEGENYLIEVKEGIGSQRLRADAFMYGLNIRPAFRPEDEESTLLDNYFTIDIPSDNQELVDKFSNFDYVAWMEPNEVIQVEPMISKEVPSGQKRGSLSINDPATDQQWIMDVLEMDRYYRLLSRQQPKQQAKIAILDTGVDGKHEDIVDNYFTVEKKYDNDPMGHGTHCAGIAAGVTNNGIGIGSLAGAGEKPFVEITSIKVLGAGGMGTQKTIIAGIIEAVDEGMDVISLSLGGPSNQSRQRAYSQAVKYAHDHGAIVVAAAGNSNRDAANYSPANADGMITVAALDDKLLRAPFSNRVDRVKQGIAAPGVGIFSTTPNNTYKSFSGTSMACPFVAGLLGVMRSLEPELTAQQAYAILHSTGEDGPETRVTGRIVQPADALDAVLGR
jgi:thermitase